MVFIEYFFANLFLIFADYSEENTRCPSPSLAFGLSDAGGSLRGYRVVEAQSKDANPIQLDKNYPPSTFHLLLAKKARPRSISFLSFSRCNLLPFVNLNFTAGYPSSHILFLPVGLIPGPRAAGRRRNRSARRPLLHRRHVKVRSVHYAGISRNSLTWLQS